MSSRRDFTRWLAGSGLGAALGALSGRGRSPAMVGRDPATETAWRSVRDFGARGDGETDDSAAIQAAVDAGSGGVIYLPPGSYAIRRTIRVRDPISIVGDGPRSSYVVSRLDDGSPALEIGHPDYGVRLRGLRLADFSVRGHDAVRTRAGGMRLHAVYDSHVRTVRLERLAWGLECNRAIAVQFDDLTVSGMRSGGGGSGEGVYLYGQSNACIFNKLRSIDHSGAALRFGYGQNLTLAGPVIESARSTAIVIGVQQDGRRVRCRGVTVLNPYFENNRPYDMAFVYGSPPVLIGGYWGPQHDDYIAPLEYHSPVTALGCSFPAAPGGAVRIDRQNASMLFLGCSFDGEVATYTRPEFERSARLRVLGAAADEVLGGAGG